MNCSRCGKPIEGVWVGDTDGVSHPECYYRGHHFTTARTLRDVIYNGDDPVIAREVLLQLVPKRNAPEIIQEFNRRMEERWARLAGTDSKDLPDSKSTDPADIAEEQGPGWYGGAR